MAAFSVSFDGTRVVDASSTTGWTADGATPTAEPDFYYQGAGSISAKIKTSEAGFYYTSSSQNLSSGVWIAKILANNKDALDGNGLLVRIGSSTTAYYEYRKYSSTTYPPAGGWIIVAIDPNVTQWVDATGGGGAPTTSAIVYWAIRADYSATAKSENTAMDAIDWVPNGSGLTGTGGDGGDTDGTFADYLAADEGDVTNGRWGVIHSKSGILYVAGVLSIGSTGSPSLEVDFTDSNVVIVFPVHFVTTGFCGIDFVIENPLSVITVTDCVFNGRGSATGSPGLDDTRPDYEVVGTAGSVILDGTLFNVYRIVTLNSKVSAQGCVFLNGGDAITADGADMDGATVSDYAGDVDTSALIWDVATNPTTLLQNMSFTKGSAATHAIEFGLNSPLAITLTNITFTGYNAANGENDSTLHIKRTSGTVNITVDGGSTPSYRSDGATVNIIAGAVTVKVTAVNASGTPIENARVMVRASNDTGPFPYQESVTITNDAGSPLLAIVQHDGPGSPSPGHGLATNDKVLIDGANEWQYNGIKTITKIDEFRYSFELVNDPGGNATGTIVATFVALAGLTDSNGEISASRVYSSAQPITGWARKSSASPFLKEGPISGTVSATTGLDTSAVLTSDE